MHAFFDCEIIQYIETPFCYPRNCNEGHLLWNKEIERIDSKKYKNMYFYSAPSSRYGIRKKTNATHWAIVSNDTNTILCSGEIIHGNENKKKMPLMEFKYNNETFFAKVSFTNMYINITISEFPSFTHAAMAALQK